MARRVLSHLTTIFSQPVWGEENEGEKEGERGRGRVRVRSSHFSLSFLTIGPVIPSETRGKVDPHCKSYAWVLEVWSFDKLREVGVFSYLDIPCLKRHDNGFRCCEAGNAHGFGSKEVELMLDEGAIYGQPTYCLGIVKNSPDLLVGPKLSMCICLSWMAWIVWKMIC